MPTIINARTATSGAIVNPQDADGQLQFQTGVTDGTQVNALTFDAAGRGTFILQPVMPVQSMVRVQGVNGYGSTNTFIRRFTTVQTNQGADITYADSATLGATFTINADGVYAISFVDQFNVIAHAGVSLNSNQLTVGIVGVNAGDILVQNTSGGVNHYTLCSTTLFLPAGSVLRAHTNGIASGANPNTMQFTIVRVA